MSDPNVYIMLMASLPSPEALFLAKRPPLSRLKLDRRLRVLRPEDARALKLTEQALHWGEIPLTMTDEEIVARAKTATREIESETVRLMIRDRLEIRTCMVALRRRKRGEQAPAPGTVWGFGRWTSHIARNWNEATFRLENVFPWLREADRLLKDGDSLPLQRLILEQAWKRVDRRRGQHQYDFEAVVAYVIKWNIVDRWGRYNNEEAAERFEELTQAALGEHANLLEEGHA
ncbi:MAG: hypothetical protein QNJ94_11860 [Alphaproteobacteria bacterium]|nr:hypothetical protein [Alphaproteobacteria bacterium]